MYKLSFDKKKLDSRINSRQYLNFDEFYEIFYEQTCELKQQFGGAGI
jgi:hypothetical protein